MLLFYCNTLGCNNGLITKKHYALSLQSYLLIKKVHSYCSYNSYKSLYAKQKHLGCKKGEANQKQQLSDYTCD